MGLSSPVSESLWGEDTVGPQLFGGCNEALMEVVAEPQTTSQRRPFPLMGTTVVPQGLGVGGNDRMRSLCSSPALHASASLPWRS